MCSQTDNTGKGLPGSGDSSNKHVKMHTSLNSYGLQVAQDAWGMGTWKGEKGGIMGYILRAGGREPRVPC